MKVLKRQEKVMTAEEAAGFIKDGDTVAIGGFNLQNKPMVMVRALVRKKPKNLWVVGAGPSSIDVDMLIGAGCAKTMTCVSVSCETYAPIGPCFRRAVMEGKLDVREVSQGMVIAMFRASIQGLPFMLTVDGVGADYVKVNPDLQNFEDPVTKRKLIRVKPIAPNVTIINCIMADPYGNGRHGGLIVFDRLATRAADKVIMVVEKVVTPDVITNDPARTTINCDNVVAVVEAPYGCHPCASHASYPVEEEGVVEYVAAARNPETFKSYLDKYVYGAPSHEDYLNLIGIKRLLALKKYRPEEVA